VIAQVTQRVNLKFVRRHTLQLSDDSEISDPPDQATPLIRPDQVTSLVQRELEIQREATLGAPGVTDTAQ